MNDLEHRFDFYPVGQGLFASGSLGLWFHDEVKLGWVYDCGTSSSKLLLERRLSSIGRIRTARGDGIAKLESVFVSHFDQDHVSGLTLLIGEHPIRKLVLPYMPLGQRLEIAFAQEIDAGDDLIGLYIDPIGYFVTIGGARIETIVLVPGGAGGGDPNEERDRPLGGDSPGASPENPSWELSFDEAPPQNEEQRDDLRSFRSSGDRLGVRVAFLPLGGSLRVDRTWEFVPYNDAHLAPNDLPQFRLEVERERATLMAASQPERREDALKRLREIYDRHVTGGKSPGFRHNAISLFLYAGPLDLASGMTRSSCSHAGSGRCSALYSGDGYLDTPTRLEACVRHFGQRRIDRLAVFQVMHHGAESNWHKGVAAAIAPAVSVFCSDPFHAGYGHPHASVLRDFWPFCPVRVDKESGFFLEGRWRKDGGAAPLYRPEQAAPEPRLPRVGTGDVVTDLEAEAEEIVTAFRQLVRNPKWWSGGLFGRGIVKAMAESEEPWMPSPDVRFRVAARGGYVQMEDLGRRVRTRQAAGGDVASLRARFACILGEALAAMEAQDELIRKVSVLTQTLFGMPYVLSLLSSLAWADQDQLFAGLASLAIDTNAYLDDSADERLRLDALPEVPGGHLATWFRECLEDVEAEDARRSRAATLDVLSRRGTTPTGLAARSARIGEEHRHLESQTVPPLDLEPLLDRAIVDELTVGTGKRLFRGLSGRIGPIDFLRSPDHEARFASSDRSAARIAEHVLTKGATATTMWYPLAVCQALLMQRTAPLDLSA